MGVGENTKRRHRSFSYLPTADIVTLSFVLFKPKTVERIIPRQYTQIKLAKKSDNAAHR